VVLSNDDIVRAIQERDIIIDPLAPAQLEPFNTSAVDLRLGPIIRKPNADPIVHRLDAPYSKDYMARNSEMFDLTKQPYTLKPNTFVLGRSRSR
jgi:deoxycytidine triphosphate deaminase